MHLELVEDLIDKTTSQLVIEKKDAVIAFTITNIGTADFRYAAGIIIEPSSSKTIGGNSLVPFDISKTVGFPNATDTDDCSVVIEKVILVND